MTDAEKFDVVFTGDIADGFVVENVKKKAALYYNGMGRGDFAKMSSMASARSTD